MTDSASAVRGWVVGVYIPCVGRMAAERCVCFLACSVGEVLVGNVLI